MLHAFVVLLEVTSAGLGCQCQNCSECVYISSRMLVSKSHNQIEICLWNIHCVLGRLWKNNWKSIAVSFIRSICWQAAVAKLRKQFDLMFLDRGYSTKPQLKVNDVEMSND